MLSFGGRLKELLTDHVYPVGSYFITESSSFDTVAKVQSHFGGTWVQVVGKFLYGDTANIGQEDGSFSVSIPYDSMPRHWHGLSTSDYNSHRDDYSWVSPWGNNKGGGAIATRIVGEISANISAGRYSKDYGYNDGSEAKPMSAEGKGSPFNVIPPRRKVYMYRRTN